MTAAVSGCALDPGRLARLGLVADARKRVELAEDGFAAVEALEMAAEPFGLVLMDLMMPAMDGLDTVAQIRASASVGQVPVLLLSSAGRGEDIARSRQLGIARSLIKPVKQSDLLARSSPP